MDDHRLASLLAEIDRLRSEVERLQTHQPATIDGTDRHAPTSRRRVLRVAGAATAAAVAGTLVNAGTASANDPNDVVKNTGNATTASTGLTGSFGGEILRVENTGATSTARAIYARSGATDVGAVRGDNLNDSGIGGVGVAGYAPGGRDFLAFGSGRIGLNSHSFNTGTHSYTTGELHQVNGTLYVMVNATTRRSVVGPASAGALYPIDPQRVYDSRSPAPSPGKIGGGQNRVVSVADARNGAGAVVTPDVVPVGATAVVFNLTVTQIDVSGYLSISAGNAGSYTASILNFGSADVANASIVPLDASRQVKIWCGAGVAHIILDISGYYL